MTWTLSGRESELVRAGTYQMLEEVARQNNISVEEIAYQLLATMSLNNGKKKGVIILGTTNSGKSFFADLLTSMFDDFEVGVWKTPEGQNVSNFLFADLLGKSVGRCEELVVETTGMVQSLKSLLEGNRSFKTEIKYKDSRRVGNIPIVITMNGYSSADIVQFHGSELTAILNRVFLLIFKGDIMDILTNEILDTMRQNFAHCLLLLLPMYDSYSNGKILKNDPRSDDIIRNMKRKYSI